MPTHLPIPALQNSSKNYLSNKFFIRIKERKIRQIENRRGIILIILFKIGMRKRDIEI